MVLFNVSSIGLLTDDKGQLTGQSATEFIRSLRLEKARLLLETTEMTVAEVAYAVGLGSPNYFSRVFQEAYGVAPSAVRKG